MSDLISRQAAIEATKKHYRAHDNDLLELIAFDIERLPSAEPKRGKWLDADICGELPVIVCDQCNTFYPLSFGEFHNFCPNCGADMREVTT